MGAKWLKIDDKAISEILVANTDLKSGAEARDLEEEEGGGGGGDCNKWWSFTKLGTVSRKEHKFSSFCRSSRRCEKK